MLYETLLLIGLVGLVAMAALGFLEDGDGDDDTDDSESPWRVVSPLRLFSLALGAGASGLLAGLVIASPLLRALAAAAGALAFDALVVRPLWKLLLRFASRPAQTLSSAVGQEAVADSRFDEFGRGIVRVTVDGHVTRLMATLDEVVPVSSGERLVVVQIDGASNTCRVAKL